jgi:hypothetical protein
MTWLPNDVAGLLRVWMRGIAAFYLSVLVASCPPVVERLFPLVYPHLELPRGAPVTEALADTWFLLALGLGVLGGMLLQASRTPLAHLPLVRLVVAWEIVVGIAGGAYFLARGLVDPIVTMVLTVPSIVIVASGRHLLRRTR